MDERARALQIIDELLLTATGQAREQLASLRGRVAEIAATTSQRTDADIHIINAINGGAAHRIAEQERGRLTDDDKRLILAIMIDTMTDEERALIGLRSGNLNSHARYLSFANSFFNDLPENQQQVLGTELAEILETTPQGQTLSARFNNISQPTRVEVAAVEQVTTREAAAITGDTAVDADTRTVVSTAAEDQALADPETAEAIARIDAARRDGRRISREDVDCVLGRNAERQRRLEARVPDLVERLPDQLQNAVEGMPPRDIINQGRDVMRDPARRERAVQILRALESGQPLPPGVTEEELRDAATLQTYASARGLTHIEDIVERVEAIDRRRAQGLDRGDRDRGPQLGDEPRIEITDSTHPDHVKVRTADVTAMRGMNLADGNGNGFDRADIDAAMERLRQSGVTLDADGDGWLDAAARAQLPSVATPGQQPPNPAAGRGA